MTTTLHDLFDAQAFSTLVAEGYINIQTHPYDSDLKIANYGQKAQFDRKWTPETLVCRGLIYRQSTFEVVARPFEKFFNWDDATAQNPPVGPMLKSNKMDGSLGIIYRDKAGFYGISTRGSFASDQAKHATHRLAEYIRDVDVIREQMDEMYDNEMTILVEIIYPENRIVVEYGDVDELVLLDVIDNRTGRTAMDAYDDLVWPERAGKYYIPGGFYDTIASEIPEDEEGYVLYWPSNGLRLKVKGATYIHLHSLLTNTSTRDIWRTMAVHGVKHLITKPKEWGRVGIDPMKAKGILSGSEDWVSSLVENVPDEFYAWVRTTIDNIEQSVDDFTLDVARAARYLLGVEAGQPRWEASQVYGDLLGPVALRYANTGKDDSVQIAAWKQAQPAYSKPFSDKASEDVA